MGLFGRTIIREKHHTKLVPYEKTVIEKRAPTDESIKIFNEFREKAIESIITSYRVESNFISGIIFKTNRSVAEDKLHLIISFNIDGQDYVIEKYVRREDGLDKIFSESVRDKLFEFIMNGIKKIEEINNPQYKLGENLNG